MNIPYSVRDKNTRINAIPGMNFDNTYVNRLIKKVDANNAGNSNIQSANTGTGSVTRFLNGDPGEPIEDVGGVIETSVVSGNKTMEIFTHDDHKIIINESNVSVTGNLNLTNGDINIPTGTMSSLNAVCLGFITGGESTILTIAYGEDTTHTLSNASIGNLGFNNDSTGFKHINQPLAAYALLQDQDGDNNLSCGIGKKIHFKTAISAGSASEWMYGSNLGVAITPALTVHSNITQNFDIIPAATYSDYHLIPMFHSTSDGTHYSGVAKKLSFTYDDNTGWALRYKPVNPSYGNKGTLHSWTMIADGFLPASDNRLKHNEKKIINGLDVIRKLEPQEYQKTAEMLAPDFNGDISGDWHYEAGFIAQEILEIPELSYSVFGGDTVKESGEIVPEHYSVNYNNIFTYGIASIKELDAIVTAQASLIKKLEARLTLLENK